MRFSLFFAVLVAAGFHSPLAEARTTLNARFADWIYVRHTFNSGELSCQALQHEFYDGSSRAAFLLVTSSGEKYMIPYFNHGSLGAADSTVRVLIGGSEFVFTSVEEKTEIGKFFLPASLNDLRKFNAMLREMAAKSPSAKFYVIDRNKRKITFRVRGTNDAIGQIEQDCGKK